MGSTIDAAVGPLHGPQDTRFSLILGDDAPVNALRVSRSRSDSLDIFTMSPLGTPPFDAWYYTSDGPSTPQLRLPEPPALDLDLGLARENDQLVDVPYRSPSPPSTLNSPTSFSFSPPGRVAHGHHYINSSYPLGMQYGSMDGGTSYGTDMTSLIGSWDEKDVLGQDHLASSPGDKGKLPQRETFDCLSSSVLPSSSKGKGKAINTTLNTSSASCMPFESDFNVQHPRDLDLGLKTSQGDGDDVLEDDASKSPVVRLLPGAQYRRFDQRSEIYAGPSSRNGDILPTEDAEVISLNLDAGPSQDALTSPASSSRPISPSRFPVSPPFRSMNEVSPHLHLPTHRRSFSSLSLRSIRSSSSRSFASIRSTFTGDGIKGKVRSMTPAAKKLKGGLRRIFKRTPTAISVDATRSTFSDEDDSDNEPEPPKSGQLGERMSNSLTDQSAACPISHEHSHMPEASSDSQATVTHLAAPGALRASESVTNITPEEPRSMSEPMPPATDIDKPNAEEDREDTLQALHEKTVEMQQVDPKVVVTITPNHFNDALPRELQLCVLKSLVHIHEEEYERAERGESQDQIWSVRIAGKTRWVGRDKGLRELVKLSRVSKAWQSLAFDGQLWEALHLMSSPPHLTPALLLRLADHAGSFVRSLELRGWTHLDPVTLRSLVRSISLAPSPDVLLDQLQPTESVIVPPFPPTNLTHVSLRTCTALTTHSLHHVLLRAPSLRSVDLHGLCAVTNTTCGVLSAYCPRLEVADLGRCMNMDGDGLRDLVGDGALVRSWTSEESGVPATPWLDFITGHSDRSRSRLKVLRVSGLKRLSEEVLASLGRDAPDLQVLDLSGGRDLTDEAIEAFVLWDEAWDMPSSIAFGRHKVELNAREAGRDPTVDSGPFFKRVTHLRHLNLSSCLLLSDAACTHLAHCVPNLEFLELAGIGQELKDEGLVRLLGTTPLLRRLDLEDASDITDAVLEVLTVPPPREVRRRGVPSQSLPPPPGQNLEHLVLSYALNVTNEALLALIRGCQRLTVLECDNTRISAVVIREFVKLARQRQLRGAEVVAVDCRAITEALVRELAGSGQTRARMGYRHYEARLLGYVDARDEEDLGATGVNGGTNVDDCDDMRVTIKSFWSWQAVDAIRQAREKRRKLALTARRNSDARLLGDTFRHNGLLDDDDEDDDDLVGTGGMGPSLRPRWLTQWARTSGSSSPISSDDDRGCVLM